MKATLTGCAAAVSAPIASAWAKLERGTAPHVASPTSRSLMDVFLEYPNADFRA